MKRSRREFFAVFGREPTATWFSPGRVNLIGEHTDYNAGMVLPIATQLGCRFAVCRNGDAVLRIASGNFPGDVVEIPLRSLATQARRDHWSDYVTGMALELLPHSKQPAGLNIYIASDLPHGGGLSSSAAITVGMGSVLNEAWHCGLTRLEIARAGQAAENRFVGMNCGILDPFAVAMGEAGKALAIDCGTLEYDAVPFPVDTHVIVVAHTGVTRQLAHSAYNERRKECEAAAERLSPAATLRPLASFAIDAIDVLAEDPVLLKRARHVVTENERVKSAVAALRRKDMDRFGELLTASHASLRSDYEVSCRELDIMVEEALAIEAAIGAKMTGGGFGGCVVAVVARGGADEFMALLAERYRDRTGIDPEVFCCEPGQGAGRVEQS